MTYDDRYEVGDRFPHVHNDQSYVMEVTAVADDGSYTVRRVSEPVPPTYDRQELIGLCEAGVVPVERWHNRDSARSQTRLGEAWALLRAGAPFIVSTSGICVTDERTVWIEIEVKGFDYFEMGEMDTETFYLPTRERLKEADGGDWY